MEAIWEKTTRTIKDKVPDKTFELWFKSIKFKDIKDNRIHLEVPNKFFKEWISENYMSLIIDTLNQVGKKDYDVEFIVVENDLKTDSIIKGGKKNIKRGDDLAFRQRLKSEYTISNFVRGPSNEFAKAACEKVIENPSREYNPLFIYGGVGLGKTHLLNAVGNGITDRYPNSKVYYITSEEFVNELVRSIRYEKMDEFQKKFRSMDVLLVDDIQFFAGKKQTQEEFFHTFNALYENQKQIVLTSDKITKEISGLEERLRSRFEWGLVADIDYPDMEHMVAILKTKANHLHSIEDQLKVKQEHI